MKEPVPTDLTHNEIPAHKVLETPWLSQPLRRAGAVRETCAGTFELIFLRGETLLTADQHASLRMERRHSTPCARCYFGIIYFDKLPEGPRNRTHVHEPLSDDIHSLAIVEASRSRYYGSG